MTKKRTKRRTKTKRTLPKLKPLSYKNVKHKYKLNDSQKKRRIAIDSGIKQGSNKKSLRNKALDKKRRLNILRIYRKNNKNKYKECMTLTKDMKYIDVKYKLGKTNDICLK